MSQFLSLIGWTFLPGVSPPPPHDARQPTRTHTPRQLATSWVQTIYYGLSIRAGDPKPLPGSPRHDKHRRTIHALVVAAYLAFTVYEADYQLRAEPSFYTHLGLPLDAPYRQIKSHFRRLATRHHPDKVARAGGAADAWDGADYFMHLKLASETLLDPARRFAYDRFGPAVGEWQSCVTIRDFVSHGIISDLIPHYGMAAGAVYVLSFLGLLGVATFYRWLALASLFLFEAYTVTRPSFPRLVVAVNAVLTRLSAHPPFLPFQFIILARKLVLTLYIAMSHIGPLLVDASKRETRRSARDEKRALEQALAHLDATTEHLDADAGRLLDLELSPFKGDAQATSSLQGKMREWLVQNTIRADPMVRDALGNSLRKRRVDAPSGARGNR